MPHADQIIKHDRRGHAGLNRDVDRERYNSDIQPHADRDEKSPLEHKIDDMKRKARDEPRIG